MNIRMIATDIDNTIVGARGTLSPRTRRALKACEDKGILTVLASGRTFFGARRVSLEAGLNSPVISANGGRVDASPEGGVIFEDTIAPDISMKIYERLRRAGCFMTSYVGTKVYALLESNDYGSKCFYSSEVVQKQPHIIMGDEMRFEREGTRAPYKYEAYSDDISLLGELRAEFLDMGLSVSSAFPNNLEILSSGGGKGRAIAALARIYGIEREQIMAFGDGSNDADMLKYAAWSVAVGNAVDSLKQIARIICPDCEDDGVARTLEARVLNSYYSAP